MTTITLANLNAADKASFVAALGDVYEHAPWVAEAVHGRRPFASLTALHEAMTAAVREASVELRVALLKGHPDLAGKAARAGTMTADSKAEQASAGLDRLSEAEYAAFPILARGAALRFTLTRAWDWLNTPADALVTRKDPLAFLRRLDFYAAATPKQLLGR